MTNITWAVWEDEIKRVVILHWAASYGEADEISALAIWLSISIIVNGSLIYIFGFVVFHIIESMSDNVDSIILVSD
jgi:hypothetical protein